MFLFSDALFESPNQDGKALEIEGVLELTQSTIVKSPATPFDFVLSEFYKKESQPLNDYLPAIWLSY